MPTITLSFAKTLKQIPRVPCQRCFEARPAGYRVTTDVLDIVVCEECAEVMRGMGLAIASLRP